MQQALPPVPPNHAWIVSPLQGSVVALEIQVGDVISKGTTVAVVLSMKMEHLLTWQDDSASQRGRVVEVLVHDQQVLEAGSPVALVEMLEGGADDATATSHVFDPNRVRPDLEEVLWRQNLALDDARLQHDPSFGRRIAKRHARGMRSARENVNDLVDDGTFIEYGRLRVAGQRKRRSMDDLMKNTPADGIITGIGCVNLDLFDQDHEKTRTCVLSYDYTVLAGTQGGHSHHKTDRILEISERMHLPVIWFCEGGGGRPGDTDGPMGSAGGAGLAVRTFATFGRLSGLVPLVSFYDHVLVNLYCAQI